MTTVEEQGVRELRLTAAELAPHEDAIVGVYDRAFREWPYNHNHTAAERFREALRGHVAYPDFEATLLYEGDQLLGFTYGHTNAPDQWWYRQVAVHLTRRDRVQVFDGAWVIVELAVDPGARRRGLGRRLLRTATTGRPHHRWAVLSTVVAESAAVSLYRYEGFVPLVARFVFPEAAGTWTIMAAPVERD
ncbi:MAG TPA: GNAT family N-acetyltransferase [Thermomicrobiales bacterium]|jgi:ribosomal protein S18 acetylase RimI-like enzyme|nr:GNAT family N-acetyltransferase [Thermomicrobiales bacterium]